MFTKASYFPQAVHKFNILALFSTSQKCHMELKDMNFVLVHLFSFFITHFIATEA